MIGCPFWLPFAEKLFFCVCGEDFLLIFEGGTNRINTRGRAFHSGEPQLQSRISDQ